MPSWKDRAEVTDDVVYFRYHPDGAERSIDSVYVWDLDKTYLDTSIDSLAGLFNAALERALNKKNVPGTKSLLQALTQEWKTSTGLSRFPLFFISASPPQMEERIFEKFSIDGIRPFGCFYKDNLRNLTPRRFWRLNKQVGYKIQALLQLRARLGPSIRQICWGDDSESDAIIYNLYSDICSRRLGPQDLRETLRKLNVTHEQIDVILFMQAQVPESDPVQKIYINLAVDTDPDYYLKFGRRTLATYNTFQVALDLTQDNRMGLEGLYNVAQDMVFNYRFTPEELQRSFDDLVKRQILGELAAQKIMDFLKQKGLFASQFQPSLTPSKETKVENNVVFELAGQFEPWVPERIDYLNDYR